MPRPLDSAVYAARTSDAIRRTPVYRCACGALSELAICESCAAELLDLLIEAARDDERAWARVDLEGGRE